MEREKKKLRTMEPSFTPHIPTPTYLTPRQYNNGKFILDDWKL